MTGWRKRTIMEMAREVKMPYDFVTGEPLYIEKLEAFAELVRADERNRTWTPSEWTEYERSIAALVREDEAEKHKWDIHSCGPTCKRYACVAMREAVLAEREACIVDIQMHIPRSGRHTPEYQMAMRMIERIRARGQA